MTEFARSDDGLNIAYESDGSGAPVVLVHGFASDRVQNWKAPGWYETLTAAGYRVIALDCRGHGQSDKPHDAAFYGHRKMAGDVIAVMKASGIANAFLMGYSMGGFISIHLLMSHPELFHKVAIGGVGASYLDDGAPSRDRIADPGRRQMIVDALLADDPASIADPTAKAFREFAQQQGKDRLALAACMAAPAQNYTRAELAHSTRPVLVVCGENDVLTGPPGPLAHAFADGRAVSIPRRDHMTAVGDKTYKNEVLTFFAS